MSDGFFGLDTLMVLREVYFNANKLWSEFVYVIMGSCLAIEVVCKLTSMLDLRACFGSNLCGFRGIY